MIKMLLILLTCTTSFQGFSQTCEERENKVLNVAGTVTAGFLYNTYGLIGSISDGFAHTIYDDDMVKELVNAQDQLIDKLITLFERTISENAYKNDKDKNYVISAISVLKGLKEQIRLLLIIVKNDSKKNKETYEIQRTKNWSELSKMMGVKE